ncbi:DUF4178 domain-containing protein [Chitinimonas sp. JJ19]|uniref:DUF4178 domain-containing protein n=1 Tax=Chitinimonas sp. JJ19 TaxID=3109352 RepID=UPI0030029B9F
MAVCGFCRSTLVRHDADLENLGKMAELAEDRSPFKLRFRGKYRTVGFELIGRLQLKYEHGYWNEWYARFDDGRLGWISEGSGLCYVTFEQTIKTLLPEWAAFKPGMTAKLGGKAYTVSNIELAHCVAAEGELPFQATPGYEAPAVDLRSETGFASLDYSESPPKVYLGQAATLDELIDPAAPTDTPKPTRTQARAFKCSSCGAPLSASGPDIRAVGCGHCGAVVDPKDANLAIISKSHPFTQQPKLAMGTQGKLRGRRYTVIGYLRRSTRIDGLSYYWDEYLLHSTEVGYVWLTESDGHWNLAKPVTRQPALKPGTQPVARFLDRDYKHFQRCQTEVVQVLGEFTWKVRVGETSSVDDYISPPYLLSAEWTKQELSWTMSEYLPVAEVTAAFKPTRALPEPVGIAANQPAPSSGSGRYWAGFAGFAVLALLLQFVFVTRAWEKPVWQGQLDMPLGEAKASLTTPPIRIEGERNLVIRQDANLDNRWLYSDISLVNSKTGETFRLGREVSYYHGSDSDGSWSEGSSDDEALISDVPAGDYVLEVEAETEPGKPELSNRIQLVRDVPIWSNFWILLLLLLVAPLLAWFRSHSFESQRWAQSDYASGEEDDD